MYKSILPVKIMTCPWQKGLVQKLINDKVDIKNIASFIPLLIRSRTGYALHSIKVTVMQI